LAQIYSSGYGYIQKQHVKRSMSDEARIFQNHG